MPAVAASAASTSAASPTAPPLISVADFLALGREFRLGHLVTEQLHPRTRTLSQLAARDPAAALRRFASVDASALRLAAKQAPRIAALSTAIAATLGAGGRVFLVGCGATGRLVLNLEELWRRSVAPAYADRVIAFMAGGDAALVRSFEGFEDHPEYGARHLRQLGFKPRDLLIAVTEGGETPYVIGAALAAAEQSERATWFVYCNPARTLSRTLARCREVLTHPRVERLELVVGPMALAGSTRLQATTVQMAAVGWALLHGGTAAQAAAFFHLLARQVRTLPSAAQAKLVRAEEAAGRRGRGVEYQAAHRAITVLADTTERSPTFNLAPFENRGEADPRRSWCYVSVEGATDSATAWQRLLGDRAPRPLAWSNLPRFRAQLTLGWLQGFDISEQGRADRAARDALPRAVFHVRQRPARGTPGKGPASLPQVELVLGRACVLLPAATSALEETLLLKLALNAHSTVLMGRLGRYTGNVMTWVKPTNYKLIDRATRYVQALVSPAPSYARAAAAVLAQAATLPPDRSIVSAAAAALQPSAR